MMLVRVKRRPSSEMQNKENGGASRGRNIEKGCSAKATNNDKQSMNRLEDVSILSNFQFTSSG